MRPRNSRESDWYVTPRRGKGSRAKAERRRKKQEARDGSVAALAHARTLGALNRLIGQSPDGCNLHSDGHYTCMWRASRATYGHALLAATIDTDSKVHLTCQLPEDGSDRHRDSCNVVIGS